VGCGTSSRYAHRDLGDGLNCGVRLKFKQSRTVKTQQLQWRIVGIDNIWKSLTQLSEANPARLARAGIWASTPEVTLTGEKVERGLYHAFRRKEHQNGAVRTWYISYLSGFF
jgi:hypothetical protein